MYERLIYFIIIIILAIAAIFGGISYFQQKQQIDNLQVQADLQQDSFNQQKENLDVQIADLQIKIDGLNIQEPEQPADPYQNWLTYTNTDYNYTLKYPKDWTVEFKKGTDQNLGGDYQCLDFKSPNSQYLLHFGLREKGQNINIFCRTGVGSGETVAGEKITMADTVIQIYNLVSDGQIAEFFLTNLKEGSANQLIGNDEITGYITGNENTNLSTSIAEYQTAKMILESLSFGK